MDTSSDRVFTVLLLAGLVSSVLVLLTAGALSRLRLPIPRHLLPRLRVPIPRFLHVRVGRPAGGKLKGPVAPPDLALFPPGTLWLFLAVLATFTGGAGTLCRNAGCGLVVSWLAAVVVAPLLTLGVAALVWWYFLSGEGASEVKSYSLIGMTGHVSVGIPVAGVGAVAFEAQGKRVTMPAKSKDGEELPKGTSVMVVNTDGPHAVVEPYEGIF
jgi:membrane protein implicated in regulation of membrane protease activity